ncbi:MAG: hypothetical protein FD145_318 [Candidatus Saganbacteria bacterium]|uniref:Uncharacterized protein n=1 Tax=Candidatus Saganbacteria bacterium TaxID=2575572 RepID=A0A833L262_UNCSA|nr:MAG: hypothetical protein FD145_318 [Candidatus Saganbacteria bacterium]
MKRFLTALMLISCFSCAFGAVVPWADIWTNTGYLTTNGESNNFSAFLLRSEGKVGLRAEESIIPLEPYVAYYGVLSQDKNYWNNNCAYGAGLRLMPFTSYQSTDWTNEWIKDLKLFSEVLRMSVLNDKATADVDKIKTSDFRVGVDVWHEWNLKEIDNKAPWAEIWGNLSYRQTSFFAEANNFPNNQFNTYLLYLQSKWGMHFDGGIRPYVCSYLTYSGVPKSWLNSFYYGLGLRVEPFREQKDPPEMLKKFKMFLEVLGISWLKENEGRPSSDFRFGVDFTFGR